MHPKTTPIMHRNDLLQFSVNPDTMTCHKPKLFSTHQIVRCACFHLQPKKRSGLASPTRILSLTGVRRRFAIRAPISPLHIRTKGRALRAARSGTAWRRDHLAARCHRRVAIPDDGDVRGDLIHLGPAWSLLGIGVGLFYSSITTAGVTSLDSALAQCLDHGGRDPDRFLGRRHSRGLRRGHCALLGRRHARQGENQGRLAPAPPRARLSASPLKAARPACLRRLLPPATSCKCPAGKAH